MLKKWKQMKKESKEKGETFSDWLACSMTAYLESENTDTALFMM